MYRIKHGKYIFWAKCFGFSFPLYYVIPFTWLTLLCIYIDMYATHTQSLEKYQKYIWRKFMIICIPFACIESTKNKEVIPCDDIFFWFSFLSLLLFYFLQWFFYENFITRNLLWFNLFISFFYDQLSSTYIPNFLSFNF